MNGARGSERASIRSGCAAAAAPLRLLGLLLLAAGLLAGCDSDSGTYDCPGSAQCPAPINSGPPLRLPNGSPIPG